MDHGRSCRSTSLREERVAELLNGKPSGTLEHCEGSNLSDAPISWGFSLLFVANAPESHGLSEIAQFRWSSRIPSCSRVRRLGNPQARPSTAARAPAIPTALMGYSANRRPRSLPRKLSPEFAKKPKNGLISGITPLEQEYFSSRVYLWILPRVFW